MTPRALALIDGEHYAPVVRDALASLPFDFVAAHLLGGTEKLRGGEDYGVPLTDDLEWALAEYSPEVVVDLSDEPVVGARERLALASRVLAHGVAYVGADFRFEPPPLVEYGVPSLGVIGLGKRVGKTTTTAYVARLLAGDRRVAVVSMGRGGPAEPRRAPAELGVPELLAISRAGAHAASDYLELAALTGVPTIGCRRCGGGLAGATFVSNVLAGAELAAADEPDLVIFDGSGAALPPIATDRRVLVIAAHQDPAVVTGGLNAYRMLVSDLVVLTMAEEGSGRHEVAAALERIRPDLPVAPAVLRPRPLAPVAGRRIAFFTTAPERVGELQAAHLRAEHGADVVLVSGNLSRRAALRADLERAQSVDAFVTELKGAAVDVVAEAGVDRGIDVILADNDLVPLEGDVDLDDELRALAAAATRERAPA